MLCGSWVSCLMFRRCLMSALDKLFGLGHSGPAEATSGGHLRPLSRRAAGELQVLAVLAPLACSDLSAAACPSLFASDAPNTHGAYCELGVPPEVALDFWLASDFKGHSALAPVPQAAEWKATGDAEVADDCEAEIPLLQEGVPKPLAFGFDFLEVGSSLGAVARVMQGRGFKVGPLIDKRRSRQYDPCSSDLREWIVHLLASSQLKSLFLAPASASFSPASLPRLRSQRAPLGFDSAEARTAHDNKALSTFFLLFAAALRWDVPVALCLPLSSLARSTDTWKKLRKKPGVCELEFKFSLGAAAPQRSFALLSCGLSTERLAELSRASPSPSTQGQGPLPACFAKVIAQAFAWTLRTLAEPEPPRRSGLESVAVNDVLCSRGWRTVCAWPWRSPQHINLLEAKAALAVVKEVQRRGGDSKVTVLSDSAVARGAIAKGRSSSRLLRPILMRVASYLLAGGVYIGLMHAPTRLNVADDPSRQRDLRPAHLRSIVSDLGPSALPSLLGLCGLSAGSSGWVRLSLLLALRVSRLEGRVLLQSLAEPLRKEIAKGPRLTDRDPQKGFDSTLGYPGEGPVRPRNALDEGRQRARLHQRLPEGRTVLERTSSNRLWLLGFLESWLAARGVSPSSFWSLPAEAVAKHLTDYGRELFDAGRPYWHYAETVNATAARRPAIRRQLQQAWDLAFSWMSLEPHTHHVAMPPVILLAVLSVCLLWGWRSEAGVFGLAWGALLRIGEATAACTAALILPRDVLWTQSHVLLRIAEPKTRLRAARHQSAKLEPADLVQLVDIAFRDLHPTAKLWQGSTQTLRRRLDSVLERLGVPTARTEKRPLDLGSFRPGGATHLLSISEDSELVRRRGRWVSHKVMEIYLQEISAATFYPSLSADTRQKVLQAASCFPSVLSQAAAWTRAGIPTRAWYHLWR